MKVMGWIKGLWVCLVAVGILVSITACSFGNDINKKIIVQGIGVDTAENGYLLSVHYLHAGAEDVTTDLIQTQGQTVFEALQNLTLQTGRIPTYAHNAMVVFGKDCAENGFTDVFDFFSHHYEIRPTVQLFVAHERAEALFRIKNSDSYLLAIQAKSYAEAGDSANTFTNSTILNITNQMASECHAFAVPELKSSHNENIQLGDIAYFRDNHLIGYFDREQTKGYLAAAHSLQSGSLVLDIPNIGTIGLKIKKTNKKVTAQIIDGIPHFQIDVTCDGYISEISRDIEKTISETTHQQFENALNQKLKTQIQLAVDQAVIRDQVDIFYFGSTLQQQQTAYWKAHKDTWGQDMVKMQYTVNVESSLEHVQREAAAAF